MYLKNIQLWNFKNYTENYFEFHTHFNLIVGKNGSGKTNLLDAIYYLCLSQSAFQYQDSFCVSHQKDFFLLKGNFVRHQNQDEIVCAYQNRKKTLQINKQNYTKLSEHIGQFPCVLLTPNDTDLVREGSEIRKKFFDSIFCQISMSYLQKLMFYNQLLKNRNQVLKDFYEKQYLDALLLESFDRQIIPTAQWIAQERKSFLEKLLPHFENFYAFLTQNTEKVGIIYQSHALDEDFEANFRASKNQDLQSQRTALGIHKDDYNFELQELALKKFASQGQQKSFVLALKMAHWQLIAQESQKIPLLLLDDIFDKLDKTRLERLAEFLATHQGQVFVTDSHPQRSLDFFANIQSKKFFEIDKG